MKRIAIVFAAVVVIITIGFTQRAISSQNPTVDIGTFIVLSLTLL